MEIIKTIANNGNIDKLELSEEQKLKIKQQQEFIKQKETLSKQQDEIKAFKTQQELERIKELKQNRITDEDIEKNVNTDYDTLVDEVIDFCSKQPLPILHDVNETFKEYLPLIPGTFTIIGGCSNAGKTTFVTKIVLDVMKHFLLTKNKKKILYLTPETPKAQVATLLLSRLVGYDVNKAIKEGVYDKSGFSQALSRLKSRIEIVDVSSVDITHIDNFKALIENRLKTKQYGFIMLDYIQCISQSNDLNDGIGTKAITRTAKLMNHWAMTYQDVSFCSFAQLIKSKKDTNEGFKERIEKSKQGTYNVCDHALELVKGRDYESSFIVRKSRLATTPVGARIKLGFDIERFCYCDIDDPVFLEKREQWKEKFKDIVDDNVSEDSASSKIDTKSIADSILGDI